MTIEVDYLKIHKEGPDLPHWILVADNTLENSKLHQYAKGVVDGRYPGTKDDHRQYLGSRTWRELGQNTCFPYPYRWKGRFFTHNYDPFPDSGIRILKEMELYAVLEAEAVFTQEDLRADPDPIIKKSVWFGYDTFWSGEWRVRTYETVQEPIYEVDYYEYNQESRHGVYATAYKTVGYNERRELSGSKKAELEDLTSAAYYFKLPVEEIIKQDPDQLVSDLRAKVIADPLAYLHILDYAQTKQKVGVKIAHESFEAAQVLQLAYFNHIVRWPYVYFEKNPDAVGGYRLVATPYIGAVDTAYYGSKKSRVEPIIKVSNYSGDSLSNFYQKEYPLP